MSRFVAKERGKQRVAERFAFISSWRGRGGVCVAKSGEVVTATPFFQGSDALFLQGWKLQSSALITIHQAAKLPSASPTKLERLERPCQGWRVDILFCPSLVGHIFCPFASSSVLNSPDFSRLDSLTSIQSCVEHLELDAAVRPLAENNGLIAERSLPFDSLVYISPPTRREPPFSLNFLLLSQLPLFPLHAQSSPTQQRQSHNIFTRISVIPVPH